MLHVFISILVWDPDVLHKQCPIQTSLINLSLLTLEEKKWLNEYHAEVESKVGPLLEGKDARALTWLKRKCDTACLIPLGRGSLARRVERWYLIYVQACYCWYRHLYCRVFARQSPPWFLIAVKTSMCIRPCQPRRPGQVRVALG
ncbi:hypothetical protein L210DRAFT_3069460 [Boletus edulis BED1]|uniref:Peptidase M24 C-terminal domain-containing protein n=1 Tax=Boletus edulis BED1 TaxID=1328754 RepID=A0AAD4BGT6_BOLED|nr:hypothetical protein L210DRAFT_3069460 [Boletus edulis BED1]